MASSSSHGPRSGIPTGEEQPPTPTPDAQMNPFFVLGLPFSADTHDIRRKFKLLAVQKHPDKGGSKEEFQRLLHAYEQLQDDNCRQRWAQKGREDARTAAAPRGGSTGGGAPVVPEWEQHESPFFQHPDDHSWARTRARHGKRGGRAGRKSASSPDQKRGGYGTTSSEEEEDYGSAFHFFNAAAGAGAADKTPPGSPTLANAPMFGQTRKERQKFERELDRELRKKQRKKQRTLSEEHSDRVQGAEEVEEILHAEQEKMRMKVEREQKMHTDKPPQEPAAPRTGATREPQSGPGPSSTPSATTRPDHIFSTNNAGMGMWSALAPRTYVKLQLKEELRVSEWLRCMHAFGVLPYIFAAPAADKKNDADALSTPINFLITHENKVEKDKVLVLPGGGAEYFCGVASVGGAWQIAITFHHWDLETKQDEATRRVFQAIKLMTCPASLPPFALRPKAAGSSESDHVHDHRWPLASAPLTLVVSKRRLEILKAVAVHPPAQPQATKISMA